MLVKVKVLSQSSRRGIIKKPDNSFEVRVKEKPIGGRANEAASKLLADYFQISLKEIKMIKGRTSHSKIFEIKKQ